MPHSIATVLECPVTRAALRRLGATEIERLNASIRSGALRHLAGSPVSAELEGALGTEDGSLVYPIVDSDILVLLPSLAIVPADSAITLDTFDLPSEMESVMRFYDEVGWKKGDGDAFADAELFEDLRPESAEYVHACHMRVARHLAPTGRYLLDAASGPIQYPDYLTYSEGYDARICADISLTALRAAKEKLGDRGVYLQCDITRLPLREGAVDGFVSLHTIYHVPANLQRAAFKELERVLAEARTGVVVYSWGLHSIGMTLLNFNVRGVAKALLRRKDEDLYFRPHPPRWFRRKIAEGSTWELAVWRSVNVPFMRRYVHGDRGRRLLQRIYRLEEAHPRLLGRLGQYPLLVFRKPGAGQGA